MPRAVIDGDRVVLRQPQMSDYPEWAALREKSRDFLKPWEPIWPADDLTRSAFRRRLKRYAEDQRADQSYSFFIALKPEGVLVGGITLANIRRGVAQAGSIGYWMGVPFVRSGHMTAAVRAVLPFSFATLRLHRVEAACIPTNTPSIRLLERCGFAREDGAASPRDMVGLWIGRIPEHHHRVADELVHRPAFGKESICQRREIARCLMHECIGVRGFGDRRKIPDVCENDGDLLSDPTKLGGDGIINDPSDDLTVAL